MVQRQVVWVHTRGIFLIATESNTNETILVHEQPLSFTVLSCLTPYDQCDHFAQMVVALAFCSKTSAVFALSAHRSSRHEDYCCGSKKSIELKLWGDKSWTICQACYHLGHRLVCLPAEVPCRTDDVWVPQPPAVPLHSLMQECLWEKWHLTAFEIATGLWNHFVKSESDHKAWPKNFKCNVSPKQSTWSPFKTDVIS